jgi:hypothetical protein
MLFYVFFGRDDCCWFGILLLNPCDCTLLFCLLVFHFIPIFNNRFELMFGGEFCLVDEVEVSENKEALIVLAGTVAGAATSFVAALPLAAEVKIPVVAFVG